MKTSSAVMAAALTAATLPSLVAPAAGASIVASIMLRDAVAPSMMVARLILSADGPRD